GGGATGRGVLLDLEGHGREEIFADVDLSRTVGWFTSLFPVRFEAGALDVEEAMAGGPALGRGLKAIKGQVGGLADRGVGCGVGGLADHGLGYGLLRYLNPQTERELAPLAVPQLGFNYLGRFAAPAAADWGLAGEALRLGGGDPAMPLAHALEVNALTLDDAEGARLTAHWTWASALLSEAGVGELGERRLAAPEALARRG